MNPLLNKHGEEFSDSTVTRRNPATPAPELADTTAAAAAATPSPSTTSTGQIKYIPKKRVREGIAGIPPISWAIFVFELFFSPKFIIHRVTGLIYLVQWFAALFLYYYDYDRLKNSPLTWSIPLTGLLQSVTAIYTFTFLPKKSSDPGYFSDLKAMTYPFIVENSFFALIQTFQWMYLTDGFYNNFFRPTLVFEVAFVFFPYTFRLLWPQTRFRDSHNDKNKSDRNKVFYWGAILVTKTFYIWAKHFIGFFLNYVRFMDRVTERQYYHLFFLELFGAFATTIGMFLHTLKFKRYIGPRTAFLVYAASYMFTFYSWIRIYEIFYVNLDLVVLTTVGVAINFLGRTEQYAYQAFVAALLLLSRQAPHLLPEWAVLKVGH